MTTERKTTLRKCPSDLPCHPHDNPIACEPHKPHDDLTAPLLPGEVRVRGWGRFWHRLEDRFDG